MQRPHSDPERPEQSGAQTELPPATAAPSLPDPQGDKLLDVDMLVAYARLVGGAVRRRVMVAAATFGIVFGMICLGAMMWPRTYEAYGRLLVQRNDVMALLVNPGRAMPRDAETPTAAAEEIVRGRGNLVGIIKETNLLQEWDRTRPLLLKIKDRVFRLVLGTPTEEDRIDALVGFIDARLQVAATDEGAISFVLRWPDPYMAQQLVQKAMQSFLNHRRVTERNAIADSIAILDRSVQALETQVSATIAELPRVVRSGSVRSASGRQTGRPSPGTMVRLARLRSALESRQQEIARLDALRAQQLAEAQTRLSAAQTIYTDGHPTVLSLRQTVAQLARESPELTAARRDARSLETEYDSLSTRAGVETANADEALALMSLPRVAAGDASGVDVADPIQLRLRVELAELAAVRERANAARAELSSSEAGFKYQYTILRPAQVPRGPISPNVPAILAAGLVASLLLALAVAIAVDLTGGVVLGGWQFKRQLRVPATVQVPRL
jgi:uncharacterized protein involved in exopolysaccharide biosynthesis